ncbi:hypothetical protein ACSHWO_02845 [Streptomyces sp. HUAS TT3]|uniref:hypothetical protein n=1 Tax=Streptomyces sp. HUAS TT3 TaxID=3447510 RepID=UPI003F657DA6
MRGPRGPSSPGGRPAPGISGVGGVGGLQDAHPAFEGAGRAAEGSPLLLGAGLQEGDELGEPGEAFGEVGGEPGGLDAAPLDCAEDRVGAAEVARDPRGVGVDADRVRRQPFEVPDQSGLTGQHIPLGEGLFARGAAAGGGDQPGEAGAARGGLVLSPGACDAAHELLQCLPVGAAARGRHPAEERVEFRHPKPHPMSDRPGRPHAIRPSESA